MIDPEYEYVVYNGLGYFRYRCESLEDVRDAVRKESEGSSVIPVRRVYRRKRTTPPPWELVEDWK